MDNIKRKHFNNMIMKFLIKKLTLVLTLFVVLLSFTDVKAENAVYNFNEGNIHSIKNTSMIRVPVLESGKYEVTCYANYYLKDKLLTKPITFIFTVK